MSTLIGNPTLESLPSADRIREIAVLHYQGEYNIPRAVRAAIADSMQKTTTDSKQRILIERVYTQSEPLFYHAPHFRF